MILAVFLLSGSETLLQTIFSSLKMQTENVPLKRFPSYDLHDRTKLSGTWLKRSLRSCVGWPRRRGSDEAKRPKILYISLIPSIVLSEGLKCYYRRFVQSYIKIPKSLDIQHAAQKRQVNSKLPYYRLVKPLLIEIIKRLATIFVSMHRVQISSK